MQAQTKKTIIFFVNRIDIGGTCVNTIPLASALQQYYNIVIAYGLHDSEPQAVSLFQQHFSNCTYVPLKYCSKKIQWHQLPKANKEIKQLLIDYKPAIVHTHGSIVGFFVRWITSNNNSIHKVHTYHGHLFFGYFSLFVTKLFIKAEQFLAAKTNAIVVLSKQQQNDIVQKFSITALQKTSIIPLGITTNLLNFSHQDSKNFKEQFGIPTNAFVLTLVGRLVAIKNPFLYLNICLTLAKKFPEKIFRFLIVGDGQLQQKMHQFVQQSNYSHLFIFTSWQMNMQAVYNATNIVLLTSINEGTPLSLMEAQYMGKPVVSANVGGVEDVVQHNSTGILINNHIAENFVQAIEQLMQNPAQYLQMSEAAKQNAQQQFSLQQQIQHTHQLYNRLLA
jgi:glycosyltransferase involved in cell wall biosynthesis